MSQKSPSQVSQFQFSKTAQENIRAWLQGAFCTAEDKKTLEDDIAKKPELVESAFYTNLAFGTGGLRGLMGLGPNRVNMYTIRAVSLGVARYVRTYWKGKKKDAGRCSVVIGYDSRHHSREFALEAANTFAKAQFDVFLFSEIAPTPLVSFACRFLHASVAVMVTASHNPPEYNGYKVYWNYGGQVLPPHDIGMIEEVDRIVRSFDLDSDAGEGPGSIQFLGAEIDDAYIAAISKEALWPSADKSVLSALYSPLHGTGGRLMQRALASVGVHRVEFVESQMVPDGSFPTVRKPNPEEPAALKLGIDQLLAHSLDIFLASDPDADRLGAVVLHEGAPVILNGNQIAAILCEGILRRLHESGRLPERFGVVRSCVTTPLIDAIVKRWGGEIVHVLPGFKYIAEKIEEWQSLKDPVHFIFGAEESYGTLYGTHARDKDAISSGAVLCEIAWHMKTHGRTLVDLMGEMYGSYGYYHEDLLNIVYDESKSGREQMGAVLQGLRDASLSQIAGFKVISVQDLLCQTFMGDESLRLVGQFPIADVLIYTLEGGVQVIIRPSGTEPKIKIYLFLKELQYSKTSNRILEEKSAELKRGLLEIFGAKKL